MVQEIPKIIHYCWFGNNAETKLVQRCKQSWKEYLPDYKVVLWNEKNFDINENQFVFEAYQKKKWAFVTDFVRLKVLYDYGGIYMDTDVEIIKNLDCFLQNGAFTGFESDQDIPTGIMGAKPGHRWIKYLLDYYYDKKFILNDGSIDITTNVQIISKLSGKCGLVPNNQYQVICQDVHLYPKDYFAPKSYETGRISLTSNTHCIHHFAGSWLSQKQKLKNRAVGLIKIHLGEAVYQKIRQRKQKIGECVNEILVSFGNYRKKN